RPSIGRGRPLLETPLMKLLAAGLLGLLLACPAFAQSGAMTGSGAALTSGQPADDQYRDARERGSGENGERLICRRVISDSSSRLNGSRRVCHTAERWREIDRAGGA